MRHISHSSDEPQKPFGANLSSLLCFVCLPHPGGPEEAGIKRSGVDEPGSYKEVVGDAAEKLSTHAKVRRVRM
jgi:hypothetical protein